MADQSTSSTGFLEVWFIVIYRVLVTQAQISQHSILPGKYRLHWSLIDFGVQVRFSVVQARI